MEKTLSNKIIKHINKQPGGMARKRYNGRFTNTTGWPDITGAIYGIRLEIEVKQPGEEPSKIQLSLLNKFSKLNIIAFWCDSFESFKAQLERAVLNWHKL